MQNDEDNHDNDVGDDEDLAKVVLGLAVTEKVEKHPDCVQG